MSFNEKVAQIREKVLKQPEYSEPIAELEERINQAKSVERAHELDSKLTEEMALEH